MRKHILFFTVLLFSINSYSQLFRPDPEGLNYFKTGSELINQGNYKGADSLLTLALCSYKNENVYYNRAISRFLQKDTTGYCLDLDIASNRYFDNEATILYNQDCCKKVDTLYYNKKRILSNKSDFRYYEIIKFPKYDSIIIGSFHDIESISQTSIFDYGCSDNLLDMKTSTTDVIASYMIIDSVKYYWKSTKNVSINKAYAYEDLKRRARILLSAKYPEIKTKNEGKDLKVYFNVYFNSEGLVTKVEYNGFFPEIYFEGSIKKLEIDLLDIADSYPTVLPAKFFKEKVAFIAYDFVEF